MAILDPKADVLRRLDPQPQDGTGPGYISALDVKTVCGNLYDQIDRVNFTIRDYSEDLISGFGVELDRVAYARNIAAASATDLLDKLEDGSITTDKAVSALINIVYSLVTDNPYTGARKEVVAEIIETPAALSVLEVNALYYSSKPNWPNPGTSTAPSSTATLVIRYPGGNDYYWWNGVRFVQVTTAGVSGPVPADFTKVGDGDVFLMRGAGELSNINVGDTFTVADPTLAIKFTVVDPTTGYSGDFTWTPPAGVSPGTFAGPTPTP